MNARYTLFTILLIALPSAVRGQAKASCTFFTFSAPSGDTLLEVNGISSSDVIVGRLEGNRTLHNSGFIRHPNGGLRIYDAPGSISTDFKDRNDIGVNIGIYQDKSTGANHGFTLEGSHFSAVNYPRATNTFLNGVNKGGAMVGGFVAPSGNNGFK